MKNSVSYFLMNCYSSQESSSFSRYILACFACIFLDMPKGLTLKHRCGGFGVWFFLLFLFGFFFFPQMASVHASFLIKEHNNDVTCSSLKTCRIAPNICT